MPRAKRPREREVCNDNNLDKDEQLPTPFNVSKQAQRAVQATRLDNEQQQLPDDLNGVVMCSLAIAPDVSGIRCIAVHPDELEMVLALENGALLLYRIDRFQNVLHFCKVRETGGRANRTTTRLKYLPSHQGSSSSLVLASYLSGQFVIYCGETLAPMHVCQRSGGAIWDFCLAGRFVYAAKADGSWHQLSIEYAKKAKQDITPSLTLQRIIPKVTGSDRALSVCCSLKWRVAAGTDDAGNIVVWRLPPEVCASEESGSTEALTRGDHRDGRRSTDGDASDTCGGRPSSLSDHEFMWTSRLAKGMALCCVISTSSNNAAPVVAVGTSIGDIVLFDAFHGHAMNTFTHHKGPISTIVVGTEVYDKNECGVLYASGWHESLRSYRCGANGEWFPAQVKRRTHYHEVTELVVLHSQQFILSASRDGTLMYSPVSSLFAAPAMYVSVTVQKFAFAKDKNTLLQTRKGCIEGFRTDAALRNWTPFFAYKVHGKYHLQGLWCDDRLHYIVFSTDERAALLRCHWRTGAEHGVGMKGVEEVAALPCGRGILDCCFVQHGGGGGDGEELWSCYLLLDDAVVQVSLAEGYPIVTTSIATGGNASTVSSMRPTRLFLLPPGACSVSAKETSDGCVLMICGRRGWLTCSAAADGTINPNSFTWKMESISLAEKVPLVTARGGSAADAVVALTGDQRYVTGLGTSKPLPLPHSLPHDTRFVACLSLDPREAGVGQVRGKGGSVDHSGPHFIATFSRGLMYVTGKTWKMLKRCTVEAAFVLRGNEKVIVLLRNVEGMLEGLPPCWRVRRFGN
ncbi:hypothetical protein ERJ75_001595400 [Trypanosoma vivax]|nr:hypothetical protein TRVL_04828 [Trypanosoma vivax]KAH8605413.1 hypothetical protein ERJ75_001595400 [Trypanosoma vivax]